MADVGNRDDGAGPEYGAYTHHDRSPMSKATEASPAWAIVPDGTVSVPRQEHRAATDLDP